MKRMPFVLMCLLGFSCFAADHSYDVSGQDENGNTVQGTVDANNGERKVSGEITDEDGNIHDLNGQWDGHG